MSLYALRLVRRISPPPQKFFHIWHFKNPGSLYLPVNTGFSSYQPHPRKFI